MKKHGYFVGAVLGLALVVSSLSAHAQGLPMPGFKLGDDKQLSPEEKERMEANERAARAAQSSIPTPKASNDPWASVRSADEPPTSKVKKPKTAAH